MFFLNFFFITFLCLFFFQKNLELAEVSPCEFFEFYKNTFFYSKLPVTTSAQRHLSLRLIFIYHSFHMNSRTKSYKLDFSEQAWIYFFYCTEIFPNKLTERRHRVVALATPTQAFSCKFCKILKNIFFTEQLRDTNSEKLVPN